LSLKNVCAFGINSQNGVVVVVARLRAGWLKNGRRNDRFISIRKFPGRLWGPPSLLYSVGTGALLRGVKWNGREAGPQSASSVEVKLCFHSLICLRGMHRDLPLPYLQEINTKASGMYKI